jgi:hypothetical protein
VKRWVVAYVEMDEDDTPNMRNARVFAGTEDEALEKFERLHPGCEAQDIYPID